MRDLSDLLLINPKKIIFYIQNETMKLRLIINDQVKTTKTTKKQLKIRLIIGDRVKTTKTRLKRD